MRAQRRAASNRDGPQCGSEAEIVCVSLTFADVQDISPIFSSYETDRVYRLEVTHERAGSSWMLREEWLKTAYRKRYDSGRAEEWLEPYLDLAPLESLRFIGARAGEEIVGLLTWQKVDWNDTLWLLDIRTRKEVRRTGVGSLMVDVLKREAKRMKVRGISVETQINNYPAIRFYRRHGFVITGFNDHLYTNRDLEKQDVALFLFWEAR